MSASAPSRPRAASSPAVVVATLLAVVVATPTRARAQFAVYTDLPDFLAATANAGTDRFDDLTGTPASPLARAAGAFNYTAAATTTELFAAGSAADRWLSANTATDVITFGGFGPSVRGVGAFFFGTDLDGAFRPGTSLTVRATGAGGTTTRTVVAASTATFLGFVTDAPVVSLSIETVIPPGDLAWPTVNDLVLAEAPATVIPEPATVVLLGGGVLGIALVTRRRRAERGGPTAARRREG